MDLYEENPGQMALPVREFDNDVSDELSWPAQLP